MELIQSDSTIETYWVVNKSTGDLLLITGSKDKIPFGYEVSSKLCNHSFNSVPIDKFNPEALTECVKCKYKP